VRSSFSAEACGGVVLSLEFSRISLKSDGLAQMAGEVDIEHSVGDCFYRFKKVRGDFAINRPGGEAPLIITITNQSIKLEHTAPAECERNVTLSGTFARSSGGYQVVAVLE
jgi:hypothetical protein